jgi:hypothetical protein
MQGLCTLDIDRAMFVGVHAHDTVDIAQHRIARIKQRTVQRFLETEIRRAIGECIGLLLAGNTERCPHALARFHVRLARGLLWRQLPQLLLFLVGPGLVAARDKQRLDPGNATEGVGSALGSAHLRRIGRVAHQDKIVIHKRHAVHDPPGLDEFLLSARRMR